jgi:hypothetical protein
VIVNEENHKSIDTCQCPGLRSLAGTAVFTQPLALFALVRIFANRSTGMWSLSGLEGSQLIADANIARNF